MSITGSTSVLQRRLWVSKKLHMKLTFCMEKGKTLGVGQLPVFCQSYFNKMLIVQKGSIDGKVTLVKKMSLSQLLTVCCSNWTSRTQKKELPNFAKTRYDNLSEYPSSQKSMSGIIDL